MSPERSQGPQPIWCGPLASAASVAGVGSFLIYFLTPYFYTTFLGPMFLGYFTFHQTRDSCALLCPAQVPGLVPWQLFPSLLTQGIVTPGTAAGHSPFQTRELSVLPWPSEGGRMVS